MNDVVRPRRGRRARRWAAMAGLVVPLLLLLACEPEPTSGLPRGFTESTAFSGLVNPTAVTFAPDGRVFVAEKRGTVQMYDGLGDPTATQVADLRTEVHNFWDRGLLSLEVDPAFPTRPYLYVAYTFDGVIGGTAPRWGAPGADSDPCPNPPGATGDGCVVSGKLARLTLNGTTTSKQDLVHEWCQQFPSHSVGDVLFGNDGALYASGGDGASFDYVDFGQEGSPVNPCGDPGAVGGAMSPPSAEGGSLRSQDLRTAADPTGLDGTVIRVSPDTGAALPDNPAAGAADLNTRRIIASGLRNPFRMTQRPGSNELWLGDVGWESHEEINRIANPTGAVPNFGWPCYEGDDRQPGYDAANLKVCEDLYAQGSADTKPYFRYRHGQPLNTSDNCNVTRGSSLSGISFEFYTGGAYPPEYQGAMFFADYSRNCVWVMTKGTDGLPDRLKVKPFVSAASGPVDLEVSPGGELFYADFNGGRIRRIAYSSTTTTMCPAGQFKAEYFANKSLSGSPATTVCEAAPLAHDWGSGSPAGVGPDSFSGRWTGSFTFPAGAHTFTATADDGIRVWVDGSIVIDQWRDQGSTTFTATRTLTAGAHDVKVEWYDSRFAAVAKLGWAAGAVNTPPQPQIATPAAASTWQVGQTIDFSGSASDPEQGQLPASALSWEMVLQHCPSDCHAHPLQTWTGVASASIAAPDHDHPAHLELRLTATDAGGASTTVSRRLDPKTASLTVASQPPGMQVAIGQQVGTAPLSATVILGATSSISAPSPQTVGGTAHTFASWSDGGEQTHNVTTTTATRTHTATFAPAGTPATCPAGQYKAEYFANKNLSGSPATTVCEAAPLDHDWGGGAPPGVGPDLFSGRWTGSFTFPAGGHTFTATADDGIRVWVDGSLVIDQWRDQGSTTFTATRTLTAGAHDIKVEWYDSYYAAVAKLRWAAAAAP